MEFKLKISVFLTILCLWTGIGCKSETPKTVDKAIAVKPRVKVPRFNGDTAYAFIEKQLSFGYRIPGSDASLKTRNWMVEKLKSYGADVSIQKFTVDFLGKTNVEASNIFAQFNPEKAQRVLLGAHWDSRLIAEKDPTKARQNDPIPGADDGASGTAALLEIARVIQQNAIDLGVDIILFDAEDQGDPQGDATSWALGAQYFSKNPPINNYRAEYGILLDMIAAEGARFGKEGYSRKYAADITNKVWKLAQGMGYGNLFQNVNTGSITDDHFYVNTVLGIPMVDIINIPSENNATFGPYHHTHNDNINIINKRNLKTVGQVVLAVLYKTSDNTFQ